MTIACEHLTKRYSLRQTNSLRSLFQKKQEKKTFLALDDVSFTVAKGERLALLGGNGAGKSTLVKVLSKVVEPTSGRALIQGRLVSLIETGAGFHPDLTGKENIFLNGAILGMSKEEMLQKMDKIVAFSGCENFLELPIKRFSSGMHARLGFAIAAHVDPDILLIDEVLSVGDRMFRRQCEEKIQSLAEEGKTLLFVGHHEETTRSLCTKSLLLEKGKKIFYGGLEEGLELYKERS